MITKHTPGPWNIGPQFRETDGHTWLSFSYQTPIRVNGLTDIALVETGEEDGEANAVLISVAPNLLKIALLLDKIDCCTGYSISHADYPTFWEAQELARQILAEGNGGLL